MPPNPVCGAPSGITGVGEALLGGVVGGVTTTGTVVVVVGATVVVVVEATVVVVVGVELCAQAGTVTELLSSVTAPVRARTRPLTCALVSSVIDVSAMMVPAIELLVPNVAELPTAQKTLHAWAPFSRTTELDVAVVRLEGTWMMKTDDASFAPFRVSVPVIDSDDGTL